jgi:hypothetical protein
MGSWVSRLAALDRRIQIGGGVGLVVLLALATFFFSSATVTLSVAAQKLQTDLQMHGSPGNYDAAFETFDTRPLAATASDTVSAPATGQQPVAAIAATGEVVFTELSCSQIPITAGTLVATSDGKQFQTREDVLLLAGNCSAHAQVAATVPGAAGDVFAGAIDKMVNPSPAMSGVLVTNPVPLAGGAEARTATTIQQSDVDAARQRLLAQLDARARADLKNQAAGWHLIASSYPQLSSQLAQPVGTEAPTFSLTVNETLKGVAFSETDVHHRLLTAIHVRVPAGYALTGDPIKTWFDITAANDDGTVTLNGHGLAYAIPTLDQAALTRTITLHTRGAATDQLMRVPHVVGVDIRESPLPFPVLPAFGSHISITVFAATGGSA